MFALTLDAQGKKYLEEPLKTDQKETRVEVRRTDTPCLHDELIKRERMIRSLLVRLQTDQQPESVGPPVMSVSFPRGVGGMAWRPGGGDDEIEGPRHYS
jgi:hypothetical protein